MTKKQALKLAAHYRARALALTPEIRETGEAAHLRGIDSLNLGAKARKFELFAKYGMKYS